MILKDILKTIREKKGADLYMDMDIGGTTHFVQVIKAPFIALLQREFTPDEETGKNIFYNESHHSLYIEADGKETRENGKENHHLHSGHSDELRSNRPVSSRNDNSGRTGVIVHGRGSVGEDRKSLQG